jgi:hypothetical protein
MRNVIFRRTVLYGGGGQAVCGSSDPTHSTDSRFYLFCELKIFCPIPKSQDMYMSNSIEKKRKKLRNSIEKKNPSQEEKWTRPRDNPQSSKVVLDLKRS